MKATRISFFVASRWQRAIGERHRRGALTAVRPGEIRGTTWHEFEQLDGSQPKWRIPALRMKMEHEHLVPLSHQAVAAITAVRQLTGRGPLVFPNARHAHRPMSEISERVTAGMRAAEARGKHLGRPAIPKRIVNEIEALAISTDLSIRQIQARIAGQASRGIVGEITKRARFEPHPTCERFSGVSSTNLNFTAKFRKSPPKLR